MLVDFMIIGAQKSGTTSLASQLSSHPEICFCKIKEPGYFHSTTDWRMNLEGYHQLYSPVEGQILGEASTMYTFLPEFRNTYKKLYEYNPNLKFIYIMRHPVERIVSHYTHRMLRNQVKEPLETAVFNDPSYINRSRYGLQIQPYINHFGRENILLLIFEEYVSDQLMTLEKIADFLKIDAAPLKTVDTKPKHQSVGNTYLKYQSFRNLANADAFKSVRGLIPVSLRKSIRQKLSNQIQEKPEFSQELRELLWQFVEDDVCKIETLLQRNLTVWRK